jgi:hypothetical protein
MGTNVWADKTIGRTSVVDKKLLFHIENLADEITWSLGQNSDSGFYLIKIEKGALEERKFSSQQAEGLDIEFSKLFIQFQYEMQSPKQKDCKKSFRMSMRSEEQSVCISEKVKLKALNIFVAKLKNNF